MILPAAILIASLGAAAAPLPPAGSLGAAPSWPRILPPHEGLRDDDAPGPALVQYRPGMKAGSAERFQTVYAVSLPFSFLWSYGLLRGAGSIQGMSKEDVKIFEKKHLVLSAATGSLLIALADHLWARRRARALRKRVP